MHTVHGATRLALVPEDEVPIPPCCHDTTDAFVNGNDDNDDDNNSLLDNMMMQPNAYPCSSGSFVLPSFDRNAVDQARGRPRCDVVSGLRSGASLLDQNVHMTTVVEEGEENEYEDACKPPPAKVPRNDSSRTKNETSTSSAVSLGQTLNTVMEPIRSGILSLADDFPSLSLFATRTNQGKDLGTEIIMNGHDGDQTNVVSATASTSASIKPSMLRRQVTPCGDVAL